jgi:hypothetical protein
MKFVIVNTDGLYLTDKRRWVRLEKNALRLDPEDVGAVLHSWPDCFAWRCDAIPQWLRAA